jgi:hypothetical protein
MKQFIRIGSFLLFFACFHHVGSSQTTKTKSPKYPAFFTIDKSTLDQLFTYKPNEIAKNKNKYVNGSTVLINSSYKENKQLKLKLNYFRNAELFVQINGKDSKILYILSDDNSVFYNGKETDKGFTFTQCKKDDILSE